MIPNVTVALNPALAWSRPKLVCVNGRIVADAIVIVSPKDPNWWRGMAVRRDGEIIVRRDTNELVRTLVAQMRRRV